MAIEGRGIITSGGVIVGGLPQLIVGQTALGGIVGYIYQPGDPGYDPAVQHGLIVAPTDQALIRWQLNYTGSWAYGVNPSPDTIGTGLDNTNRVIDYHASGSLASGSYAAYVTRNYNGSGYTDWFLPSTNELAALWPSRSIIGMGNNQYWASSGIPATSQNTIGYAGRIRWNDGQVSTNAPYFSNWVRAVRYF